MPVETTPVIASRCQEIQSCLGGLNVPEFENIPEIGMAVRLSLHINGLPFIDYEVLKQVCVAMLDIPRLAVDRIVTLLADIEFVRLRKEGSTIKGVLPDIPFLDEVYSTFGEYVANETHFNEAEQMALAMVGRLAASPYNKDSLRSHLGGDNRLFERSIEIGKQGSYLVSRRARGRDVIISPVYFAENGEIFADQVVKLGAGSVSSLLDAVRLAQGWPLRLIERDQRIDSAGIAPDQVNLLKRLACDGVVKPPSLKTTYSGENQFMFTPTPAGVSLRTPAKRTIYENAMAIVSAVRLGQLLPEKFAIRKPVAVLQKLRSELRLGKATTEFTQQYAGLARLRIMQLIPVGGDYKEVRIIDTPDNRAALDIAYQLVAQGQASGLEIDEEARQALQSSQEYVDSVIRASQMRRSTSVTLAPEIADNYEQMFFAMGEQ